MICTTTHLADPTCGANPYYLRFFLQSGDPIIDANNIPIQESFIGSIVCEDSNGNGQADAGEPGIPNALVYLYNCADTINPIDSTLSNAQGAYTFDGLSAGDYIVQFTAPDGYRLPKDAVPANEIANRNGYSPCINLTTGECDTTTTVCMTTCTEIVATVSADNIIEGETITINLTGGPEFLWSPNTGITNTTTSEVTLSSPTSTIYTVAVEDTYGCAQTLAIPISVTARIQNFVRITNPCKCTSEAINDQSVFTENITIYSLTPNENWVISESKGIYDNNSLVTTDSKFTPGIVVDGYYTYSMPIQHLDEAGYSGKFTNGTATLGASNTCSADQSCGVTIITTPDGTPTIPVIDPIIIMPMDTTPLVDTIIYCDGTNFRSEGAEDNTLYKDTTARNNVITICAQNNWQSLLVTFNEFDLAKGDTLYVFEGIDTLTSKLIGKYNGVGVSQTGGWVASSCDPKVNAHGCLTFQFKTNGDNAKGTGWRAKITCEQNSVTLTPPNDLNVQLECENSYTVFDIKPATVMADCGMIQDSQIVRVLNAKGEICIDTCLASTDVLRDTFALGTYIVQYKLKSDTTKEMQAVLAVQAPSLVCNDEINVPLGSSCAIQLTPDDLLESTCDTITDTMYYFISIIGKDKNGNDIVLATGGGKGGDYPMVDKDMIEECGGAVKATIERRYFGGTNLAICNNGIQSASCEVTVNLTDQSAPIFTNLPPVDTFVTCTIDLTQAGLGLPTPEAIDNCGDATVTFAGAAITSQGSTACDTTRATVSWTATDKCGNTATATQDVVFIRPSLKEIVKTGKVTLSCDGNGNLDAVTQIPGIKIGRLKNGVLIPSDTIPLSTETYTCGYILEKQDVFIPASDCGKKAFRYWTILDWCAANGLQPVDTTFIEFKDTKAPEFVAGAGESAKIALEHFACTYDVTAITTPAATDNCSTPTVRLNKVSRIKNGIETDVPVTDWVNLNADSFNLQWIAGDECSEQLINDTVNQIIIIEDMTKPSAVCTDQLHVSLGKNEVRVHYQQVDGGSFDACGIVKYEVSRDEITWDSIATFDCQDLHQDNKLYLRVTDATGNQNTCWMNVVIEDKIAPICSDLPDMTGTCDEGHIGNEFLATDTNENGEMEDSEWVDLTDEQANKFNDKYGNPNCSDNVTCYEVVIQQQYQLIEKACGIATIKRRYRAIDWNGEGMTSGWAEQVINIESKADWSITLPADWKGECGEDVPTSELIIKKGACDLMAYEVEEKVFTTTEDACLKVVRTFTIINWCKYEAGGETKTITRIENEHGMVTEGQIITSEGLENIGRLEYIQILKLKDETAPVITVESIDDCIESTNCQATKRFAITATDCNEAATATLNYNWTINTGDIELGKGIGAEFEYPVATGIKYEIVW